MKKVYMLEQGAYSDYGILGICSSEEKAKEVIKLYENSGLDINGYDKVNIREVILDEYTGMVDKKIFFVNMDKEGNTKHSGMTANITDDYMTYTYNKPNDLFYIFHIIAKDIDSAVKIANEKRTGLIISGEWDRLEKELKERK
jgi:hypothetical protein